MVGSGWIKSDTVFNLIKKYKDCGIDGVGFQSHFDITYTDEFFEGIRSNIKRYAEIGIEVHITELDVLCMSQWWEIFNLLFKDTILYYFEYEIFPFKHQCTEAELERQAEIYGKYLQICLEEPNCTMFITWGFTNKYSWLKVANGLPFDDEYNPTPAFDKMFDILSNFPRDHPAVVERVG